MPKYTNRAISNTMIEMNDLEKSECIHIVVVHQKNCNRIWGNEYLLLDSNTFMGGTGGSAYESIIEMFVKIRNEETRTAPFAIEFGKERVPF